MKWTMYCASYARLRLTHCITAYKHVGTRRFVKPETGPHLLDWLLEPVLRAKPLPSTTMGLSPTRVTISPDLRRLGTRSTTVEAPKQCRMGW